MAKLTEISRLLGAPIEEKFHSANVDGVTCRSSECRPGIIFAALRGEMADGHGFAADAYKNGARAFILEHSVALSPDAAEIIVPDARAALSKVSLLLCGDPHKKLQIIGVTGTKGKSTVVHIIKRILDASENNAAEISTVGFSLNGGFEPTLNTTPESDVIAKYLRRAADAGEKCAVIEVSSQGIKQKRVDAIDFDVGVLTNISRDHIGKGEHGSFAEYKNCKKEFISRAKTKILNADDRYFSEFSCENAVTYGINSPADVVAGNIKIVQRDGAFRSEFDVTYKGQTVKTSIDIPGIFAVYDALAAISACLSLGVTLDKCYEAIAGVSVPGRFEKIETERDIDVVIDYAHNGDSMKNALIAARELSKGRVICVFGSVGGRTKMRRAALGRVADKYADLCIVTSDNPNFENPIDICEDIAINIKRTQCKVMPDRESAIRYAVDIAEDGDFLLIAGKGHEKYQQIGGKKIPFDEREIIRSASKIKTKI